MIKRLKKDIKVYDNIGFDIETYDDDNKFYMASLFFSESEVYVFYDKKKLHDFFIKNSKRLNSCKIWAHNLGFDFLGTFWDTEHFKDFKIIQRGSDFIACKSYIYDGKFNYASRQKSHKQDVIQFCDTMNFFKGSLKKIGHFMKIPKLKKPDFLGQKPKNFKQIKELEIYNINDSRITKNFADFLQKTYNDIGAELKFTLASVAMDLWKRKYIKDSQYFVPYIKDLEKQYNALYGGRTEVFNRGFTDEKINCYDFNSLYPSVMDKELYPDSNTMHRCLRIKKRMIYDYQGFCHAELEYQDRHKKIPFLELRHDNKLLFPKGKLKGYYTFLDIKKSADEGYKIKSLSKGYYFTRSCRFFGDFVKDLYDIRLQYQAQNNPMQLPIKLVMNSLFGKFGQKLEQVEMMHEYNMTIEDHKKGQKIGNTDYYRIKKKTPQDKINFILPIISAYVTSYARQKLYDVIKDIENDVFYCDTDSIFTTKILDSSNKLGDLKHEYSTKEAYFIKPKFYAVRKSDDSVKIKIKGNHGIFTDIDNFKDFLKVKRSNYTKFMKLRESMIRSIQPNYKYDVIKKYSLEDDKRDWLGRKFNIKDFQESKPLSVY